jgi:hypothetical protein
VAHALVGRVGFKVGPVGDVVEKLDAVLGGHVPEDVDIAVGASVGREDVVVGDDDDAVRVPDARVFTKLLLEDAKGAGAAHVVRHQLVHGRPDVL